MKNKILSLISNFQKLDIKKKVIIGIIGFLSIFLLLSVFSNSNKEERVKKQKIKHQKINIVQLTKKEKEKLKEQKKKIKKEIFQNYKISEIIKEFKINFNTNFPYFFVNYRNFPLIRNIFNNEYQNIYFFKKEILFNINKKKLCEINEEDENIKEEISKILNFFKVYNYKIIKYFDFERDENKNLYYNPKFTGILFSYIPYLSYSFYNNNKIKDFTIFCNNTGQLIKYTNYFYFNNKNDYHKITYILNNNKISKIIEKFENKEYFYTKKIIFNNDNKEIKKLTAYLKNKKTNEYYININIEMLNNDILTFQYKYFYYSLLENEQIKDNDLFSEIILLERKSLKDYLINNVIRTKKYLYKYNENFYELIKKEKFDNTK